MRYFECSRFQFLENVVAFAMVISFVSTNTLPSSSKCQYTKTQNIAQERMDQIGYLCVSVCGVGRLEMPQEDLAMGTEQSCVLNTGRHGRLGELNTLGSRSADSLRRNGG